MSEMARLVAWLERVALVAALVERWETFARKPLEFSLSLANTESEIGWQFLALIGRPSE